MSESGAIIPYPTPVDPVIVAVYDTATGHIRQTVQCALQDMHRQHHAWDGCDYLEVLDPVINPHDYVVDLVTKTFVPRTAPSVGDVGRKEQELRIAARISSFQSSATGMPLTYSWHDDQMRALMVATVIGGDIEANGAPLHHTAEQTKQVLTDYASLRDANAAKLLVLLNQVDVAEDRDSLAKIAW